MFRDIPFTRKGEFYEYWNSKAGGGSRSEYEQPGSRGKIKVHFQLLV